MTKTTTTTHTRLPKPVWFLLLYLAGLAAISIAALLLKSVMAMVLH